MQRPTIFVTGATGKTGSAVVTQLLQQGWPVRALVHLRDARSEALAQRGAEVVEADLSDAEQLIAAMRGTQRAYYVPPFHPHMLHSATAFAVAARAVGLESIVQMSQWLSQAAHPSAMTRQTWLVDQLFSGLPGIAHTIVNPGMFADNFLRVIDYPALLGIFPVLTGESQSAPVASEDIARVVVTLLADPAQHAGRRYRPTGPTLLSGRQMAAIIAKAVGHRVLPVNMPFWLFRKVARLDGVNPYEVFNFRDYVADHRAGAFAFEGGVTTVVEDLTGAPAEDFETTARRYAALPFARQTLLNRLRAFLRFNLVPFVPGYDLDAYQDVHEFPLPSAPCLSMDDATWRADRSRQNLQTLALSPRTEARAALMTSEWVQPNGHSFDSGVAAAATQS